MARLHRGGFTAGNGGDALVPMGTPAFSAARHRWVRSLSSFPERTSALSLSLAISGVLQPPRSKVCLVLELAFVLAGVGFNLC